MGHEKRRRGRGDLDATSVVLDLQELHSAILNCDAYCGRTCIQTVLYKLLQGRGRSVDNLLLGLRPSSPLEQQRYLSRGNLIDHRLLKPYYRLWFCWSGVVIRHCKPWGEMVKASGSDAFEVKST